MDLGEIVKEELKILAACTVSFRITKEVIDEIGPIYMGALEKLVEQEKHYREFFKRCRGEFSRFPSYAELKWFLNHDTNARLRKANYE